MIRKYSRNTRSATGLTALMSTLARSRLAALAGPRRPHPPTSLPCVAQPEAPASIAAAATLVVQPQKPDVRITWLQVTVQLAAENDSEPGRAYYPTMPDQVQAARRLLSSQAGAGGPPWGRDRAVVR